MKNNGLSSLIEFNTQSRDCNRTKQHLNEHFSLGGYSITVSTFFVRKTDTMQTCSAPEVIEMYESDIGARCSAEIVLFKLKSGKGKSNEPVMCNCFDRYGKKNATSPFSEWSWHSSKFFQITVSKLNRCGKGSKTCGVSNLLYLKVRTCTNPI